MCLLICGSEITIAFDVLWAPANVLRCDRFVPASCTDHCPVLLDEHGAVRNGQGARESTKRLDFAAWLLAWDRYALGASRLAW